MREYGKMIEKDYGVAFELRIGLNSGPVIPGAIGDDLRMDYTAVGDTTEEFLDYLIRWMAGIKVLLVLLYRPEYTHSWGSRSCFNRIGVDQLSFPRSA